MALTRDIAGLDVVSLEVDPKQLAELDRVFDSAQTIDKILSRALNDAGRKIRSLMVKKAAKQLPFRQKIIRQRVFVRKAHRKRLFVRVTAGKKGWPLYLTGKARQTKTGVRVSKVGLIRGAFIATMPSGHTGIFRRKGAGRLPIEELYTDSVTEIITRLGADRAILTEAGDVLYRRVAAQAQLVLEGKRAA